MKNKYELWWNRISGEFLAKTGKLQMTFGVYYIVLFQTLFNFKLIFDSI